LRSVASEEAATSLWQAYPTLFDELDHEIRTLVICHHGVRSRQIASFQAQSGFKQVSNLEGGIDAWAREIDPRMARN
jgi:rhodanese-related sulfurtransferase